MNLNETKWKIRKLEATISSLEADKERLKKKIASMLARDKKIHIQRRRF